MTLTGEDNTDIMLDESGQPVADEVGQFRTVTGDDCWKQDIILEAYTEEGELFYEDETGVNRYGFGLTDYLHAEHNSFLEAEIKQRVKSKIDKRDFLDSRKTQQHLQFYDDKFTDSVTVSKNSKSDEYNMEFLAEDVRVVI